MNHNLDLYQQIRKNHHTTHILELNFFVLAVLFCNLIISCIYGIIEYLVIYTPKFFAYANQNVGNISIYQEETHSATSICINALKNFIMSLLQIYTSLNFIKFQIIETGLLLISVGIYMIYRIKNATDITINNVNGKIISNDKQYSAIQELIGDISIAANVIQPKLFIIPDNALNATAIGTKPNNTAIGLTKGLVNTLSYAEMSGVIGHEISHIKFHDTEIFTIGNALQSIFLVTANFGKKCLFLDHNNSAPNLYSQDDGSLSTGPAITGNDTGHFIMCCLHGICMPFILLSGILLEIIAWPAYLICYILQIFVIKNREYLADAEGINFTRYPIGLIHALQKIDKGPNMQRENTACSCLFIDNPIHSNHEWGLDELLDCHPAISNRVQRLEEMM